MNHKFYRKIIQQTRLDVYKGVLLYARDNGYIITSLIDWYGNYRNSNEKVLILRHDVDYDYKGAGNMFKLEKELGVKSTFYFRWLTMQDKIMNEMHRAGFEVSLHYETLATYAKKNHIFKKEQVDKNVIEQCRNNLSLEINNFEKKYFKMHTLCSHGDKRNRILGIPNQNIVDKSFLDQHQLFFKAYDEAIISKFDAYISDNTVYADFAWKHSGSPFTMMDEQREAICLLTHPIHWNQSFLKNIKMSFMVYNDNR